MDFSLSAIDAFRLSLYYHYLVQCHQSHLPRDVRCLVARFVPPPVGCLGPEDMAACLHEPKAQRNVAIIFPPHLRPHKEKGEAGTAFLPRDSPCVPTCFVESCKLEGEEARYLWLVQYLPLQLSPAGSSLRCGLQAADGCIVCVDIRQTLAAGPSSIVLDLHTERALREAVSLRVQVALLLVGFTDISADETVYQACRSVIDAVALILSVAGVEETGLKVPDPRTGTVLFGGNSLSDWGLDLPQFARFYSLRFGIDASKLVQRMWGDHWYDPTQKCWRTEPTPATPRTFCSLVLAPIRKLLRLEGQTENLHRTAEILAGFGATWEKSNPSEPTAHTVDEECVKSPQAFLCRWLPLYRCIGRVSVRHLPAPTAACWELRRDVLLACQKSETPDCQIAFVWRGSDKNNIALVRIFCGHFAPETDLHVVQPSFISAIKCAKIGLPHKLGVAECLSGAGPGSIVALLANRPFRWGSALVGAKTGSPEIYARQSLCSDPSFSFAVEPIDAAKLPNLVQALRDLVVSNPDIQACTAETGENLLQSPDIYGVISSARLLFEAHLARPCGKGDLIYHLRETVTEASRVALVKSPNKHNRLYATARPLSQELVADIENGSIPLSSALCRDRAAYLVSRHGWDPTDARRVWAFGPENCSPCNAFVDQTKGVQYLNEIRDSSVAAFLWATREGVLCEEPIRGMLYAYQDVTMISDALHRGGGQIIATARRSVYACQHLASPRLLEPLYRLRVHTHAAELGEVYRRVFMHRGLVEAEFVIEPPSLVVPHAVVEILLPGEKLPDFLKAQGEARPLPLYTFAGWQEIPGDPLVDDGTRASTVVREWRIRKGLRPDVKQIHELEDKL